MFLFKKIVHMSLAREAPDRLPGKQVTYAGACFCPQNFAIWLPSGNTAPHARARPGDFIR